MHIHHLAIDHNEVHVTLADDMGRLLQLEITPDDHPALLAAFERFCEVSMAAAKLVMLDLIGSGPMPDTADEITGSGCVAPCRLCGHATSVPPFSEEDRATVIASTYCDRCHPEDGRPRVAA